jgi:hypothetical protein
VAGTKNLKPFKPGQSGNPGGRPSISPEEKKYRSLSRKQFSEMGSLIVTGNWEELQSVEKHPDSTVLEKLVAKVLLDAHKTGNWGVVNSLLDRLIGKPTENVQLSYLRRVVKKLDGSEVVYTNEPKEEE